MVSLFIFLSPLQKDPNDPSKPFWATRGRRSGGRAVMKADDDILTEKWQPEDDGTPDLLDKRREQATSVLASIISKCRIQNMTTNYSFIFDR